MRDLIRVVMALASLSISTLGFAEDEGPAFIGNQAVRIAFNGGLGISERFTLSPTTALLAGVTAYRSTRTSDIDHVSVDNSGQGITSSNPRDTTRLELMAGYRTYWRSDTPRFFMNYTVAGFYEKERYGNKTKRVDGSNTTTSNSSFSNKIVGLRFAVAPGVEYFFTTHMSIEANVGINASYGRVTETTRHEDNGGDVSGGKASGTEVRVGTFTSAVSLNYYW